MKDLYDLFWIRIAVILSIIVAVIGFPVFQHAKGFPSSLFWTAAVIAGVWLTYLIRAWAWGEQRSEERGKTEGRINDK